MARHLESLASHYDQMADALHDSEAGISHSEEEMQGRRIRGSFVIVIPIPILQQCIETRTSSLRSWLSWRKTFIPCKESSEQGIDCWQTYHSYPTM